MSKLHVIGTPIGNLEDISPRALSVLKEVDVILCEDTRVTKKLLNHYEIKTKTLSYHSQSGEAKIEKVIELLKEGNDLALVSDAGTPAISDPGSFLISRIRKESPDTEIITIPGPSAVISALSISGLPSSSFLFLGFLPHKKGRETLFKEIADSEKTVAFYESPHRIMKTLDRLTEVLEDTRTVVIARELTKMFEQTVSGTPQEVLEYFNTNEDKQRGEFVVIVSPK
jgi:16S rRNA (cytidine1402-2'-O)-methyltransferase